MESTAIESTESSPKVFCFDAENKLRDITDFWRRLMDCNAFFINPATEKLEFVKVEWRDGNCLESLYGLLRCRRVDYINLFDGIEAADGKERTIDIWVNDDGMWENSDAGFTVGGETYFGGGVVLASDENGKSMPLPQSLKMKLFDWLTANLRIWKVDDGDGENESQEG